MSDESISFREDKENLMYIFRKIKLEQYQVGEDVGKESSSSSDSTPGLRCFESDINLHKVISKQVGPEVFNDPEMIAKTKPFDFLWTYGFNTKTGLINLSSETRKELFFACSHFAILYNYCTKQMKCLEGHQYLISSISADNSGRWLVTADEHKDGCIIIWDSAHYKPIYSLFNIYPISGPVLIKISGSARYLVTIGTRSESKYSVNFWLWTYGRDDPDGTHEVDKKCGVPIDICFNPNVEEFIMVIFKRKVLFLVWDNDEKKFTKSKLPHIPPTSVIGTFTSGTYLKDCHECYVCGTKGCVSIFGNTLYSKPYQENPLDNLKIHRTAVRVSQHALRSCVATDRLIVIGDGNGAILFFDKAIKLLFWFRDFPLGPVTSISFNAIRKFQPQDDLTIYTVKPQESHILDCDYSDITGELQTIFKTTMPRDASVNQEGFLVNDFFIATNDNNIYAVDFLNSKCTPIFISSEDTICAIDLHHEFPYLVIAFANGKIQSINYDTNELVFSHFLPSRVATTTCLKYSPYSMHLLCGQDNGEIWELGPISLYSKRNVSLRPTTNKIVKIVFSANNMQFAYYDSGRSVGLFLYNLEKSTWNLAGKVRSHYEDISDISFLPIDKKILLYTIGYDRHVVEYDNDLDDGFRVVSRTRFEQKAIPTSLLHWYEIIDGTLVNFFIIADNEHKFKLLEPESKIPKSVFLAPAYGCFKNQIIKKMMIIPKSKGKYMVFMTNKQIGLHIIPPDGNPYKYVGYLVHPNKVLDFVMSPDGKYIFTFGADDRCIFKWKIKTKAVELMHLVGGKELEPFYCLIEGGKNGWLFQEIKDLFYYMQILQQENIEFPRRVSDTINISELPELIRTCGFYPTEFELENLMIDIKYKNFFQTGILNFEITFIEFVKLFCNHKPVYGYSKEKIKEAFYTIIKYSDSPDDDKISREELTSILSCTGEFLAPDYLLKCLKTISRSESSPDDFEFLPEKITFDILFNEMFGVDMGRNKIGVSELDQETLSTDQDEDDGSIQNLLHV